jgi:hypothetical protein
MELLTCLERLACRYSAKTTWSEWYCKRYNDTYRDITSPDLVPGDLVYGEPGQGKPCPYLRNIYL